VADEVNIGNVGGEGVASEVTLARLVAVTEAMSKKAGVNPEDVTKKLKALADSTDKSIKTTKQVTKADKALASAGHAAASALTSLASTVGGTVLSAFTAVARSGFGMAEAFLSGSTNLADFAGQIPLVGAQLSKLAGAFDNGFAAFQNVAGSGAAFNNSLTELRNAAAGARMPLDQFASMIGANSDKLAAFGGTATDGAKQIVALNKALGSNRQELMNMGLGYQEINEALIDYQYLQRAGNRGLRLSAKQQAAQAESAAEYTKNLVTLGKLTGEDVKSQQEKIAAAQMDVAMQSKLAMMSAEERKKMDALMADTMASGGQAAVDALKREFLGMPPMTEEAALYTSQFGENVSAIGNRLDSVYDSNVTAADMAASSSTYMAGIINGNAAVMARLGPGLTAAAAGLDGPMATIATQLAGAGIQFTDFIDATTGEVDQTRLLNALESAKLEGDARDTSTQGMVSFMEALSNVREALQTQIISPLMEAVAPALLKLSDAITGVERDEAGEIIPKFDEDGNIIKNESAFADAISLVSGYITDTLAPGILTFVNAFQEDPKKAIQDMFANIKDAFADILLGPNTKKVMGPGGEQEVEIEREGGLLSSIGTMAGDAMLAGIKSLWENTNIIEGMIAGVALLWAGPKLATAMAGAAVKGIGSAFSRTPTPGATPRPAPGAAPGAAPRAAPGGRLAGLGRGASRLLGPLAALLSIAEIGMVATDDSLTRDEKTVGIGEAAGGGGGALAGAAAGALVGSVVPVIGTAIGGAIGGALGYFGGRWAGGKAGEAIVGDGGESATPTASSPGAQLAQILTEQQVDALERIGKVNLSDFNTSLGRLDISNISYLANVDFTTFASGLKTFAEIPDLKSKFETINSLDASPVRSYTEAMEDLVEVLEKVNEVLAEDNSGMFGGGTGVSAADMLGSIGTSTSGTSQGTQQLNTTMQQVLILLTEMRDLDIKVESNTKNIRSSNLAQGGVSN
jgi:hypothetical protein|tara:strand:+ start:1348 stop:4266 length:2919 start_codon:yes stop_codon:yes gene_type:complete